MSLLVYFLLLFAPYSAVNCSQFVCKPHRANCTATQLYRGCDGRLAETSKPRTGDVVAYNGAHVAVYVSKNFVIDSTPEHGVWIHRVPSRDTWYAKPKFFQWKKGE